MGAIRAESDHRRRVGEDDAELLTRDEMTSSHAHMKEAPAMAMRAARRARLSPAPTRLPTRIVAAMEMPTGTRGRKSPR